ncbi:MAG: hypothetical protein DHS20C18_22680 [Saprospiraceae bacterium]|nr:MAG: hypothetical protein DHS20C18_22680 [Saprospiraceae bacterium]
MVTRFSVLFISLLVTTTLLAQSTIQGTVKDMDNQGVFFATVALYRTSDSTIVKANTSEEDGSFVLSGIMDGAYFLKVNMLGYADSEGKPLTFPTDHNKSVEVTLEEAITTLDEVVVKSRLPTIQQKSDRLIVNIENSLIGSSGSLLDALKNVPGMIVSSSGLQMAGQSNITILLNGRSTQYMNIQELLKDMPADNIKQVEVIHQPGAEFDASGTGPIINIILKKNNTLGTNGRATLRVEKDYKWLYWTGLSLNHYNKGLNINGYAGYSQKAVQESMDITRKVADDTYTQSSFTPNDASTFGTNLSLDWDINDKQRLGFAGQFWNSITDQVQTSTTNIDYQDNSLEDLSLATDNTRDGSWNYFALSPYYSIVFDTSAHKLDIDVNLFSMDSDATNTLLTQNVKDPSNFFAGKRFDQPGDTKIAAIKVDYSKPLSASFSLDAGLKYSIANLENNLGVFDETVEGMWIKNAEQSNLFTFEEDIKAAYMKLNFALAGWTGSMGLRWEDSYSLGKSVSLGTTLDRRINKLFPSFSLQRQIAGPIGASVAYSYRIDRPGYSSLNPFTTSLDPFTGFRGNPILIPALTHSMKLNLLWENYPFLTAEYKLINDPLVEVTEQNDETGETFLQTLNLNQQRLFNIQMFVPLEYILGNVPGYIGGILNYNEYDSEYLGQRFNPSRWTYTLFMRTGFTLPGKIRTEIVGSYVSGVLDGIVNLEHFYRMEISFGRKFLNDRLAIQIGIDDIPYRFRHGKIKYANMDIDILDSWYVREINLNIAYQFGNRFLKEKQLRKLSAEEEINRTQN